MIPNFKASLDELFQLVINTEPTDWIDWEGGDCPVHEGTPVKVKLRGGSELPTMLAGNLPVDWYHYRDSIFGDEGDVDTYDDRTDIYRNDDIIAYKVSA